MTRFLTVLIYIFFTFSAYAQDGIIKAAQDAFELYSVGNFEEAAYLFEETAQMMKENAENDITGRMKVSLYAGLSFKETEDYISALPWLKDAFELAAASGQKAYAVNILSNIAETLRLKGDYKSAVENYLTAINYPHIEDREKATLYYGLAETYRLSGDYDSALETCAKSKELSKDISMEKLYLSCSVVEGESYRMKGDYAKSLQIFGVALDISRARNYLDIAVASLNGLGLVSETLELTDAARSRFEEALSLSLKNEDYDNVVLISGKIISLLPEKGTFSAKGDNIMQTVSLLEPLKDTVLDMALLKLAYSYYKISDSFDKMFISAENAYMKAISSSNDYEAAHALYGAALALYGMEKYSEASNTLDEAISRLKSSSSENGLDKMYNLKNMCLSEIELLNKPSESFNNGGAFKE